MIKPIIFNRVVLITSLQFFFAHQDFWLDLTTFANLKGTHQKYTFFIPIRTSRNCVEYKADFLRLMSIQGKILFCKAAGRDAGRARANCNRSV